MSICVLMVLNLLTGPWHSQSLVGQDTTWQYVNVDFNQDASRSLRKFEDTYSTSEWQQVQEDLRLSLFAQGFIDHSQKLRTSGDTLYVSIDVGSLYQWKELELSDETKALMRQAGVNVERFKRQPISPQGIERVAESTLDDLENKGFPFASFSLDSVEIEGAGVSASLEILPGRFVTIDSVRVKGDLKIRKTYLTNYLGIKEGSAYDEQAIAQIPQKTEALRFVSQVRPPEIYFGEEETKLTLYLNKQSASSLNGIVGVLPDATTGEILITGDAQLHLENALRQGEEVDLNWRKLQTRTQELTIGAVSPYVLNSPVSIDGELKIYRRDTLFTDVFRQLGIRYNLGALTYVRLFVDRQTSDLISTSQYETGVVTPPFLDRAITSYGLGGEIRKLDRRFNPTKGFSVDAEIGAGNKEIIVNQNLPEIIYDSLDLLTFQLKSKLDASYYLPVISRVVWHQNFQGATLVNDQLSNNENHRIGGFKNLRGFDEESIFASSYAIARTELRYLLDEASYVFAFGDVAWYENTAINAIGARRDVPYGFGAGISFASKAGIFSLMYALGAQQNNPILLRAGKVHFGFISLF